MRFFKRKDKGLGESSTAATYIGLDKAPGHE